MITRHRELHRGERAGWLRAAVLGADDGVVSTASLMLGVTASSASHGAILTAGIAGMVAGAMSMATGEFVSVSSQRDTELADLRRETAELAADPEAELDELTRIYEERGLDDNLARQVAEALSGGDRLAVHARDELGQDPSLPARPIQAAWVSAASFAGGAVLPILVLMLAPAAFRTVALVVGSLVALAALGGFGARAGGARWERGATRVLLGGGVAMAVTAMLGRLVGAAGL